jgi:hypothetical protein
MELITTPYAETRAANCDSQRACAQRTEQGVTSAITADRAQPRRVQAPPARRRLTRGGRHAVLSVHIAASVAILGDSAAFLAIALRARSQPAHEAHAAYEILGMLSLAFGIPLSFVALTTGIVLGLGSRWGVFRYPWVIAKLALLVSVMAVGGLVLGSAEDAALDGTGGTGGLVAGATWDVLALTTAVGLSVFQPGRARRGARDAHVAVEA